MKKKLHFDPEKNYIHFVYQYPGSLRNSKIFKGPVVRSLINIFFLKLRRKMCFRSFEHIPWPAPVRAPMSISKSIGEALVEKKYRLKFYDLEEAFAINPVPGDVLLGHIHPDKNTVMRKSIENSSFLKKIFISPYNGSLKQVDFIIDYLGVADYYFAICGDYWFAESNLNAAQKKYNNKFIYINMGINLADYPQVKTSFGPEGKRKFFYIGRPSRYGDEKGEKMLEQIARRTEGFQGGCIFPGNLEGWKSICQPTDLRAELIEELVAKEYDFFINCSRADAQATTVLEAMSWGFPVACTKETGYNDTGIFYLSTDDVNSNLGVLEKMQFLPAKNLIEIAASNRELLAEKYNWPVIKANFMREFERIIYE